MKRLAALMLSTFVFFPTCAIYDAGNGYLGFLLLGSGRFTVGGTISGLLGSGLVLQNNSGDSTAISANGSFAFGTQLTSGSSYSVSILTQPGGPAQVCVVLAASGTALSTVTTVEVSCTKRVFLTASTTSGNMGGKSGADNICNVDSNRPSKHVTYKAMLSDANRVACTTANCGGGAAEHTDWVFASNKNYYRSNGTTEIFQANASGIFVFGALTNSFTGTADTYWTAISTATPWALSGAGSCTNWSSNSAAQNARPGLANQTDITSISAANANCDNLLHLLCVEQ